MNCCSGFIGTYDDSLNMKLTSGFLLMFKHLVMLLNYSQKKICFIEIIILFCITTIHRSVKCFGFRTRKDQFNNTLLDYFNDAQLANYRSMTSYHAEQ